MLFGENRASALHHGMIFSVSPHFDGSSMVRRWLVDCHVSFYCTSRNGVVSR